MTDIEPEGFDLDEWLAVRIPRGEFTVHDLAADLADEIVLEQVNEWVAANVALVLSWRLSELVHADRARRKSLVFEQRFGREVRQADAIAAAAAAVRADDPALARSLLDFDLTVGKRVHKPLGECNRDDLDVAISDYRERAAQNERMADFLAAVRKRVKPGKTVAETYTNAQLERLMRAAQTMGE